MADVLKMKECTFITRMPCHQSLVTTFEMILDTNKHKFHIVMEKMDMSLIQLMDLRAKRLFSIENVKLILYQILCGLSHIHANGFFHRDIKPENVLVTRVPVPSKVLFNTTPTQLDSPYSFELKRRSNNSLSPPISDPELDETQVTSKDFCSYIIKLTDFGLARETNATSAHTSYVSTRWYRAPEILLRSGSYGPPVDIWAFGTMAIEMSTFQALFPGKNEADQIHLILQGLGSPSSRNVGGKWPSFKTLARKFDFKPIKVQTSVGSGIGPFHQGMEDIIDPCLKWDPLNRETADRLLSNRFFENCEQAVESLFLMRFPVSCSEVENTSSKAYDIKQQPQAIPVEREKLLRKLPISRETSVKRLKGNGATHVPPLQLSSSPLGLSPFSPNSENWNNQQQLSPEIGIQQFHGSSAGITLAELSPIAKPDDAKQDTFESTKLSSQNVPSDFEELLNECLNSSNSDSFYTAQSNLSNFDPPGSVVPRGLDVDAIRRLDGALECVDNLLNVLATPISPFQDRKIQQDQQRGHDQNEEEYRVLDRDSSDRGGLELNSYDYEGDMALKRLTTLLDSDSSG